MVVPLNFISDLFNFITNGTIVGIPTLVVMAIPFIVGLIVGYLVKKVLKIAIIIGIIAVIFAYFGIWGLSFDKLQQYGGLALQGALLFIGILPLGVGFIIGLILGFIFG